jgi:membrane protein DedA with SNARE-associated domain
MAQHLNNRGRMQGMGAVKEEASMEFFDAIGWYLSIFLWLYFTGIGLPPFPEEGGIGYAAYLAAVHPNVHWWWAWPVAGAAILCADTTLYGVGRWFGPRLFEYRWVQRLVKPERRRRFEHLFHSHGIKILLTARLLPPLRTGVFIVAGAVSFSFVRFLLADAVYAIFGVGLLFFCGTGIMGLVHKYANHEAVYILVIGVVSLLVYYYFRRLRAREVRLSTPDPITLAAPASLVEAVEDTVPRDTARKVMDVPAPVPQEISSLLKD